MGEKHCRNNREDKILGSCLGTMAIDRVKCLPWPWQGESQTGQQRGLLSPGKNKLYNWLYWKKVLFSNDCKKNPKPTNNLPHSRIPPLTLCMPIHDGQRGWTLDVLLRCFLSSWMSIWMARSSRTLTPTVFAPWPEQMRFVQNVVLHGNISFETIIQSNCPCTIPAI